MAAALVCLLRSESPPPPNCVNPAPSFAQCIQCIHPSRASLVSGDRSSPAPHPISQQFAIPAALIRWASHLSTAAGSTCKISPSSPARASARWAPGHQGTSAPPPSPPAAGCPEQAPCSAPLPGRASTPSQFPLRTPPPPSSPPPTALIKLTLVPALGSIFSAEPSQLPSRKQPSKPTAPTKAKLILPGYCTKQHAVRLKCSTIPSVPGN